MVQFGDRIDYDFTILGAKTTDKNSPCYGLKPEYYYICKLDDGGINYARNN